MGFKITNEHKIWLHSLLLATMVMVIFDVLVWDAVFYLLHVVVPRIVAIIVNTAVLVLAWNKIEKRMLAKQNQ